jgi:uncharacterized protein Smg (DUF494 family)
MDNKFDDALNNLHRAIVNDYARGSDRDPERIVSMREDMDMLLDALMGSMIALKNSENVSEEDREADMQPIMELFLKYIELSGQRYPIEDLELDDE